MLMMLAVLATTIATGRDLIRSAEVRSVITDFNSFEIAVNTFELKYGEKPGDIPFATSYWPNAGTENGDGDQVFDLPVTEGLRAWQHLTLSVILDGSYSGSLDTDSDAEQEYSFMQDLFFGTAHAGQTQYTICHVNSGVNGYVTITVANPAVYNAHLNHGDTIGECADANEDDDAEMTFDGKYTVGKNVPAARMKDAGFSLEYTTDLHGRAGNIITFAIESDPLLGGATLSPEEAWIIDDKIDDGVANTGNIMAGHGELGSGEMAATCLNGDDNYNNDEANRVCQLHFWLE